jgi:hypothetical protein
MEVFSENVVCRQSRSFLLISLQALVVRPFTFFLCFAYASSDNASKRRQS